jgi:hypothetical protein
MQLGTPVCGADESVKIEVLRFQTGTFETLEEATLIHFESNIKLGKLIEPVQSDMKQETRWNIGAYELLISKHGYQKNSVILVWNKSGKMIAQLNDATNTHNVSMFTAYMVSSANGQGLLIDNSSVEHRQFYLFLPMTKQARTCLYATYFTTRDRIKNILSKTELFLAKLQWRKDTKTVKALEAAHYEQEFLILVSSLFQLNIHSFPDEYSILLGQMCPWFLRLVQ